MTNYVGFINSMLSLREQRLKEALARQDAEQKQQAQFADQMSTMGKGLAGMFGSIGANQQQGRQDAMANSLMAEQFGTPPRAQAVKAGPESVSYAPGIGAIRSGGGYVSDPAMQSRADTAAQGMPGFYRGGMDELKLRMGMAGMRNQQIDNSLAQQKFDFAQSKYLVSEAEKAKVNTSKDLQQDLSNDRWYIKEMRTYDDAITKATTPEQYQNAVDAKLSLNRAAQKRGMKVDPIDPASIAPFMTADDKKALKTQREEVTTARTELEEAKKAPPGVWDRMRSGLGLNQDSSILGVPITFDAERAVKSAQEKFELEQKSLREMPGGAPRATAVNAPQTPTTGGQAAGGGMATISSQEASAKLGHAVKPGSIVTLKDGTQLRVQ